MDNLRVDGEQQECGVAPALLCIPTTSSTVVSEIDSFNDKLHDLVRYVTNLETEMGRAVKQGYGGNLLPLENQRRGLPALEMFTVAIGRGEPQNPPPVFEAIHGISFRVDTSDGLMKFLKESVVDDILEPQLPAIPGTDTTWIEIDTSVTHCVLATEKFQAKTLKCVIFLGGWLLRAKKKFRTLRRDERPSPTFAGYVVKKTGIKKTYGYKAMELFALVQTHKKLETVSLSPYKVFRYLPAIKTALLEYPQWSEFWK